MDLWGRLLSGHDLLVIPMKENDCIDQLDNVQSCPSAGLDLGSTGAP